MLPPRAPPLSHCLAGLPTTIPALQTVYWQNAAKAQWEPGPILVVLASPLPQKRVGPLRGGGEETVAPYYLSV